MKNLLSSAGFPVFNALLISQKTVITPFIVLFFIAGLYPSLNAKNRQWSPEDIVGQESASDFTFSPDGTSVAWVKSRNSSEKDQNVTDLFLTRLDKKKDNKFVTVRLTRSEESDRKPFFSQDGQILYFLSSRDEGKKLWALNLLGGEPYEVHTFDEKIKEVCLLDNGRIVFLAEEGELLIESQRKARKDNTQAIEDTVTFKPVRLFYYDPDTKKTRRLTDNRYPIHTYAVSKNGKFAVTGHVRSPHYGADAQPSPAYYFWDLESGQRTRIIDGLQMSDHFNFTGDHSGFYFTAVTSSDPQWEGAGISELYYVALPENTNMFNESASLSPVKVPLEWENGIASGYEIIGNDVLVSLANGPTRKLALYEHRGNREWLKRSLDTGEYDERVAVAAISDDHTKLAFVYSTASTIPQYRVGELKMGRRDARLAEDEELFRLNTGLAEKHRAKTEIFRWTGAEGDEVNGILYYPENHDPDRRYPLTVAIRGGPAAVTLDWWNMSWAYFPHFLSQNESFVLMPNYHGSSNHGLVFVESIKHRYYELELIDIVNGIHALDQAGMIDTDSLGVTGWSNGSILSIALSIEYPEMFRVIGAGAGNVNWVSDYGTCMFGVRFDQSYIGGAPWDSTGGLFYNKAYIDKSPIFRMEQVETPTIIFFGSEDRAVPRDQGWEHYRALQQIGKAPVRFLWFPDQPHGFQKITHQTRKIKEEWAWFERYLFGTLDEPNRAFKEDSPLAKKIKQGRLAIDNGYYGQRKNDKLIPEVVPIGKDTIAIGRFPVTHKQYQTFDPSHSFHPLHGNHPVRYIPLSRARAYTQWLTELTGDNYRLPDAEEAKALHKTAHNAGSRQNTLNRLAGYDITVDEVELLKQKTKLLPADRLVQQVGRLDPVTVGEAEIYDLGGNVCEWFATESENHPAVYGYSVWHYVDARDDSLPEIIYALTGFRVIREKP